MSALEKFLYFSEAQYLEFEKTTSIRHEYVNGSIHAMAGANEQNNLITGNIFFALRASAGAKKNGCRVFASDMKFRSLTGDFYYFPDVMMVCDQEDSAAYYKEKPCFIAEVSSVSTASIDRREKWLTYSHVPSLRYYLLVDANQRQVEYYVKDAQNQWQTAFLEEGETLDIDCENYHAVLDINMIYADVIFA